MWGCCRSLRRGGGEKAAGFSHMQSLIGDPGVSQLPPALPQQGQLPVDPDCARRGGGQRLVREVQHQEGRQPAGDFWGNIGIFSVMDICLYFTFTFYHVALQSIIKTFFRLWEFLIHFTVSLTRVYPLESLPSRLPPPSTSSSSPTGGGTQEVSDVRYATLVVFNCCYVFL